MSDTVIRAAVRSSVGQVRSHNEDAVLVADGLFAVADGMGGHAAGECASATAITELATLTGRTKVAVEDLRRLLGQANRAILDDAIDHPERAGMGTTVVGMVRTTMGGSAHWLAFNIGDSRLYSLHAGQVMQLSVDHSEVQDLLAAGRISAEQAAHHPLRHVVTRSLGSEPGPIADIWLFPLEEHQRFLLCSDGLSDEISDDRIAELTSRYDDPQDLADALVRAAEAAGGRDNVSVIVVSVDSGAAHGDAEDTATGADMEAAR